MLKVVVMEVSFQRRKVVSSAYCDSLTSPRESGSATPLMVGLFRMFCARISAVRTYRGIDRAQPCLRPRSSVMKDVCQPFTLTELWTDV